MFAGVRVIFRVGIVALLAFGEVFFEGIFAAEHNGVGPALEIEADSFSFDTENGTLTYLGNVVMTRPDLKLYGDKVLIFNDGAKLSRIEVNTVTNPGRIVAERDGRNINIRAETLVYDPDERAIHLKGDVLYRDGAQTLMSDDLVFDLNSKLVRAVKGKKRVRMLIPMSQLDIVSDKFPKSSERKSQPKTKKVVVSTPVKPAKSKSRDTARKP